MAKIIGVGSYLPNHIMTNEDFVKNIETSNEWIIKRTGITQRHIAKTETTSELAFNAATQAIKNANINSKKIDIIVVATTTPDYTFPSVAAILQNKLNISYIPVFDIQAVCSGFIYGLEIMYNLISSGKYNIGLLVAAEKISNLIDWQNRDTSILFGDGAGAVILQKTSKTSSKNKQYGIIDNIIYADGSYYKLLHTTGGVGTTKTCGSITMEGRVLFRLSILKIVEVVNEICKKNNIKISEIDYFIPHQANIRIINAVASELKIEQEKIVATVSKHANCSAASIPLALKWLMDNKKIKKGQIMLLAAFGAGLTWGASLIRW